MSAQSTLNNAIAARTVFRDAVSQLIAKLARDLQDNCGIDPAKLDTKAMHDAIGDGLADMVGDALAALQREAEEEERYEGAAVAAADRADYHARVL